VQSRVIRVVAACATVLLVTSPIRFRSLPRSALAQANGLPNILLVVTDDQRPETLAAMPILRNRVIDRGVRFGNGYVPHALCCPARASILTGNHSHTTNVWTNALRGGYSNFDESSTLATWLQDAGYQTGLFGKYLNHWSDADPTHVPPGWNEWFAFMGNCCEYYGFNASINGSPTVFGNGVYSATETARRAAEFILARQDAPTFVMWTPDAPHPPATPELAHEGSFADLSPWRPPNHVEKDVSDKPRWVRSQEIWTTSKLARHDDLRRRMFESMQSVDDGLGVILDALETIGKLSNTLIVFTSDNGFLWGEHRYTGKAFPWKAGHRVPFVIRYDPAGQPGKVSNQIVQTIDIAPTIARLLGLETPPMDGRSLLPVLRGDRLSVRSWALIEHGVYGAAPSYCGVRTRFELFVRYPSGAEEYYDYREDPWELKNRASAPSERARVSDLRRWVRSHCLPTPPGFHW
jgi:N-acetylglucosamine-6-sulfatase